MVCLSSLSQLTLYSKANVFTALLCLLSVNLHSSMKTVSCVCVCLLQGRGCWSLLDVRMVCSVVSISWVDWKIIVG